MSRSPARLRLKGVKRLRKSFTRDYTTNREETQVDEHNYMVLLRVMAEKVYLLELENEVLRKRINKANESEHTGNE